MQVGNAVQGCGGDNMTERRSLDREVTIAFWLKLRQYKAEILGLNPGRDIVSILSF